MQFRFRCRPHGDTWYSIDRHRSADHVDIPNLLRETGDMLEDSAKKGKLTFRIRKS